MTAILYGVGTGPGDPELLTLKALKAIKSADIIAFPKAKKGKGRAFTTVEQFLQPHQRHLELEYPITEGDETQDEYFEQLKRFYDDTAAHMAEYLRKGQSIALLCEGDPFFYGSFIYWYQRLHADYKVQVISGISSSIAASVCALTPLCMREDRVLIIPGTLSESEIVQSLHSAEAYVIMKLGRNFAKVRRAIEQAGLLPRAIYIEQASCEGQYIAPLAQVEHERAPYFSLITIPTADVPL